MLLYPTTHMLRTMHVLRLLFVPAMIFVSTVCAEAGIIGGGKIIEELEPPSTPGNSYSGTFRITPSMETWAFGVGNGKINDTSVSGFIDGRLARRHWVPALISRQDWNNGFDFNRVRPIGATGDSDFQFKTSTSNWRFGSSDYVAFYWLYESGDGATPVTVLRPNIEYDNFRFFTSGPNSPFAIYTSQDGETVFTGETIIEGAEGTVPEPGSLAVWGLLGCVGLFAVRRRVSTPT